MSPARLQQYLTNLDPQETEVLEKFWHVFAHNHQSPPEGPWSIWLLLGGRGAGKTRTGAEWVRGLAHGETPGAEKISPIALVGEADHDVREVMIEGVSGILATHMHRDRPTWIPSRRRLEWPSGVIAQAFSAEDPDSLCGPQFAAAWCDELAKWRYAEATFDMLQFGLRLGKRPRQVITTTPRPIALLKRLMSDPATVVTRAATNTNARNLSPVFLDAVLARYAGTRLGRQEIGGEVVEDRTDALWSRAGLEICRVSTAPPLAWSFVTHASSSSSSPAP